MSQELNNTKIRKALAKEAVDIHSLLGGFAQKGLLLPRSLSEIYDHLRDYFVIEDMEAKGQIIAVCALGVCWGDLAEVRSLAVAEHYHGKGLGYKSCLRCERSSSANVDEKQKAVKSLFGIKLKTPPYPFFPLPPVCLLSLPWSSPL